MTLDDFDPPDRALIAYVHAMLSHNMKRGQMQEYAVYTIARILDGTLVPLSKLPTHAGTNSTH